jgi:hypothetical protein
MKDEIKIRMYDEIIKPETVMITGRLKGAVPKDRQAYDSGDNMSVEWGYCQVGVLCHLAAQDGIVVESDEQGFRARDGEWNNSGAPRAVRLWAGLSESEHERMTSFNDASPQPDGWRIPPERKMEIAEKIKNGYFEDDSEDWDA